MANDILIEARGVTRILPGIVPTTLVRNVDLAIRENEFVAITGPSGSGKSSLLYLLGLLDLPTDGEVTIRGKGTVHMAEEERAFLRLSELGFVFQFHFLLPEFTAQENVMLQCVPSPACRANRCAPAPPTFWTRSALRSIVTNVPINYPAGNVSVWLSRGRLPTILRSSSPTSLPVHWILSRVSRCFRSCAILSSGATRPWWR
jgi:predicted ABC-type transport system involved in lysophospholipase L1 biosynthesis ATPase subunit